METENKKRLVIVDCDPGADDAWAIIAMVKTEPHLDYKIQAFTCCSGNTTIDYTTQNTLTLLKYLNRLDIPVYSGSSSGIIDNDYNEFFFGRDGFGDFGIEKVSLDFAQKKHAVLELRDQIEANPGQIILMCLGPLTNIALLYKMFPESVEKIKEVHIMGGNDLGIGNVVKRADFNFWYDPESAWIVLRNTKCPIFVTPLETSRLFANDFPLKEYRFDVLSNKNLEFCQILDKIEDKFLSKTRKVWIPCDLFSAFCFMIPKAITKMTSYHATVELSGVHTRGKMVVDHLKTENKNVKIIENVDVELLKKILMWICEHQDFDFSSL